jgi:hypothetical protein
VAENHIANVQQVLHEFGVKGDSEFALRSRHFSVTSEAACPGHGLIHFS